MARRRKARKSEVSLFPFLDILACVIGNLILIITTVVLEQMDTSPVAEAARIDEVRAEADAAAARAKSLEKELAALRGRSGAASKQLDAVRRRISEAEARLRESERRLAAASAAPRPAPTPDRAELAKLDAERKKLEAEIAALERQIAERRKPPEQMIAILPAGGGRGPKRGVFVEAAKDRLIVHEKGKPWDVPTATIAGDSRFKKLLAGVKADKDAIVTFLVRADGLQTLAAAQQAAEAAGVRAGRVPLPGDGAVDLSATR